MTISEKVAYAKGMFEGMALNTETSKEAKLIGSILEILEEVGLSIEDLEDTTEVLGEGLDAVSDDLEDLENVVYDDEDEDEDDEDDDDDFFETPCPNCGADLVIDESVLDAGTIECPACNQKFALDVSDDCDCGCNCDD